MNTPQPRRIVQIAAAHSGNLNPCNLYALMSDGSLWLRRDGLWVQLPQPGEE